MDIPGVGLAHNCRVPPRIMLPTREEKAASERRVKKKLPPMEHPEGEPIVGAHEPRNLAEGLQKQVDEVKKRGRPKTKTPEERKAYRREWARKKREQK